MSAPVTAREQPGRPPYVEERRRGTVNHEDSGKDDAPPQTPGDCPDRNQAGGAR